MAKKPKKTLDEAVAENDARRDMSSPEWFLERLAADERRAEETRKAKEEAVRQRPYGDLSGVSGASAESVASAASAASAEESGASSFRKGGMVKKKMGGMVSMKKGRAGRGDGCATRGYTKGKMY